MITTVAGGVGAARMLVGLALAFDPADLVAVVNTADDLELHGLHISPDLDTVIYTLAGAIDTDTGWGLEGETWQAMEALDRYGGVTWFGLGDKDLATHLYRTHRLRQGARLHEVTAEIAAAWQLGLRILPMSDERVQTRVTLVDEGEVSFQEYFVERGHNVAVEAVRFDGAGAAAAAPGVLAAIAEASTIVIAPSNPIVSIAPVLAVPGVRAALEEGRGRSVAVSPIVGGVALKGPADRLMRELGHEASVVGVARLYQTIASTLVIDHADAHLAAEVEACGLTCVVTDTVMRTPEVATALARTVVASSDR